MAENENAVAPAQEAGGGAADAAEAPQQPHEPQPEAEAAPPEEITFLAVE